MVLLSFDAEEFDVPLEHGVKWDPISSGMEVSAYGTVRILDCLAENDVRATFFCTANFAENAPELMRRIIDEGHEVASHGCDHWNPSPSDPEQSRIRIERACGATSYGYRQPRMFPVDNKKLAGAGYLYNSSANPTFIPERYMHLDMPRTWFVEDGVVQIPASVSPVIRIPLFWLSLHHFPQSLFLALMKRVLRSDGYCSTYFHPWEFYPLNEHKEFRIPYIIRHNSGKEMYRRLDRMIKELKMDGHKFITYKEFADRISRSSCL